MCRGLAVLKASGYMPAARSIVALFGFVSLLLAPFGAHGVNTSMVAASICTGSESYEDPAKRYVAGIAAGPIYIVVGLFGGVLAQLLRAMPKELIVALAGLALIGSITTGLVGRVTNEGHRDSSVITFLVAASGVSLPGLGAAFWSLVFGGIAYLIPHHSWAAKAKLSAAPPAREPVAGYLTRSPCLPTQD
jgi:benzoate membrane transport protein